MKKNMNSLDRVVRILLAALFAVLYFTGTVTGTIGLVLLVLGGIFLLHRGRSASARSMPSSA